MKKESDCVAILLATFNGEKYIAEQLDSILAQTDQSWHLYVHDDGSTDKTIDIINDYILRYPGKITILSGLATNSAKNNFFYLLKSVEASLYLFCDQDDVWLPYKIELERKTYLENDTDEIPILVFTDLCIVDENLKIKNDSLWNYFNFNVKNVKMSSIILQNIVNGCTLLINKKMRDMMISYKRLENVSMHDKWAALIALKFGKMLKIDCSSVLYRQHECNNIGAQGNDFFAYFKRKLFNWRDIKKSYEYTRRQAKEFCESFNIDDASDVLNIYARIDRYNKIKRIYLYAKHGFFSKRIPQNIGLILFG